MLQVQVREFMHRSLNNILPSKFIDLFRLMSTCNKTRNASSVKSEWQILYKLQGSIAWNSSSQNISGAPKCHFQPCWGWQHF